MFWLSDKQWVVIEPLLPKNQTGPVRTDDRRILSGIIHVLQSGCRWRDCPREYGPYTTVYNRFNRWSKRGHWQKLFSALVEQGGIPDHMSLDSTHVKAHRCASGGKGGRKTRRWGHRGVVGNTKVHALSDPYCRPVAFHLTCGQVADIKGGEPLALIAPPLNAFLADKAYDCTRLREYLEQKGTTAVIPNKCNRKNPYPFDETLYKASNTVERMFCRLKDFRRIATRYDKLAQNYLSALCLASVVAYWIN